MGPHPSLLSTAKSYAIDAALPRGCEVSLGA